MHGRGRELVVESIREECVGGVTPEGEGVQTHLVAAAHCGWRSRSSPPCLHVRLRFLFGLVDHAPCRQPKFTVDYMAAEHVVVRLGIFEFFHRRRQGQHLTC